MISARGTHPSSGALLNNDLLPPQDSSLSDRVRTVASVAAAYADPVDREGRPPREALEAMRAHGLLSLLIPSALGGDGAPLREVVEACHALGGACASAAMVFAMHQSQVATLVAQLDAAEGASADWLAGFLAQVARDQLLLASVTSEMGVGGEIRRSICAVEPEGDGSFRLEKGASTLSYGSLADAFLISARRHRDAPENDQVLVVTLRADTQLELMAKWDAIGLRGTGSDAFRLTAAGREIQILPTPFGDILTATMLPVTHLLWGGVWTGIAGEAAQQARAFLRKEARRQGGDMPKNVQDLTQMMLRMRSMQAELKAGLDDFENAAVQPGDAPPLSLTTSMNLLKINLSEGCLEVARQALMVCGFAGYRYGTSCTVGRHLRDLQATPLMIHNGRLAEALGPFLILQKPYFGVM